MNSNDNVRWWQFPFYVIVGLTKLTIAFIRRKPWGGN